MKFGQLLKQRAEVFDPEVRANLLDYKRLKKLIGAWTKQQRDAAQPTTTAEAKAFVEEWMTEFRDEVLKFNEYFADAADDEEICVARYEANLKNKVPVPRASVKESYLNAQELKFFAELNRVAARKILKKFTKNVPAHDVTSWIAAEGLQLPAFQDIMYPIIRRLVAVHASLFHGGNCNLSEMELDYSVSCASEVLAYLMEIEEMQAMPTPAAQDLDAPAQ